MMRRFKDGNLTAIGQDRNGSRPQWTLVLREVNSQSSGKYTCRVWNEAGEITYVYTLKVIGESPFQRRDVPELVDCRNL